MEGRLTGGLAYAAYKAGAKPRPSSLKAARRAEQRILAEARRRSPRALGDLALVELLAGKPDKAVALLERAATTAPRDALLLSDLAAAYIARGSASERPYDLVRALAAADRALRIDPHLQEAHFNRSLALEKLPLANDARRAWSEVFGKEPETGWRVEAQDRLKALTRPAATAIWKNERQRLAGAAERRDEATVATIVHRFPQPAKLYAEEELLAEWAEQAAQGREPGAERTLRIARAVGVALVRQGRDAMVHDAVAAIDGARQEHARERLWQLAEGHRRFTAGLNLYKDRQPVRAASELRKAEEHLRRAASPFAAWADLYLASCDHQRSRLEPARGRLETLRRRLPTGLYPSLEGRISLLLSSIDVLRGRPGDALPRLHRSRAIFTRTGDTQDLSSLLQHLARIYRSLGEVESSWKYLLEGLKLADSLPMARRLALLDEAGLACQEGDYPEVALYFQNEILAETLRLDKAEMIAAARRRRALTLLRLGRLGEAGREIVTAQRWAAGTPDQSLRQRLESDILTTRAEIDLPSSPATAALSLDAAIRYYEQAGYRLYLPLAHLLRARARLASGDTAGAENDFRAALTEIEGTRESLLDPRMRIALFDQAAALFDETLTFLVSHRRIQEAFLVSEQAHARQLLESLAVASLAAGPGPLRPDLLLPSEEIRRTLPPGIVLIKYAVLEDRLLIWALSSHSQSFQQFPVRRVELEARIARARAGVLAGRNGRSIPELRQLYQLLVAPLEDPLAGSREVIFVPDQELSLLPFAALVVPRTGRYLVEERAVAVAPSANVYVRCLHRLPQGGSRLPHSALVVGAAEFDRMRFPSLGPLPRVKGEAEIISRLYPSRWLLTGPDATRERFFTELESRRPEVLHFAGHAMLNSSFPELSLLLFAPDTKAGGSGAVYSHELYRLRLDHVRLVVLSACNTAAGKLSASEGAMGIARPFLAAGVPTVLASLGSVEDGDSLEILTSFHQRLRAGDSPAAALRSAQLTRIAAGSEEAAPSRWALFEIIGASAPIQEETNPWPSP